MTSRAVVGFAATVYLPWLACLPALLIPSDFFQGCFFSIHSGIGILLLLFSAPWAFVAATLRMVTSSGPRRAKLKILGLIALTLYPLAAWPYSLLLHARLTPPYTNSVWDYYRVLIHPLGRLFPD